MAVEVSCLMSLSPVGNLVSVSCLPTPTSCLLEKIQLPLPDKSSITDGGNQQFTVQRMTFKGCDTAVQIIWDWSWTWKSVTITDSSVGFMLDPSAESSPIGSILVMDTVFNDVEKAIVIGPASEAPNTGTTGLVLDSVQFNNVNYGVADTDGNMYLGGSENDGSVQSYILGPMYNGTDRSWVEGGSEMSLRNGNLLNLNVTGELPNVAFFERPKEQYESNTADDFVHLKDLGAKGMSVCTSVFYSYSFSSSLAFFPSSHINRGFLSA